MNELWKILEKEENLRKWQQVVPTQFYTTVLQQKKSNIDRNQVEQSFKLVLPHQIIKCNGHKVTNVSQSGAKVKDIYRQAEHFKNNHKESKVENIVIQAGKNHIHRESPRDTEVKSDFHDTVICFLGILPKRGSVVFDSINYMYIYIYIYIYIYGIHF